MSVREYIGARYVPIFAEPTAWDNTKTYEPLTIVLYQGNSYTSKQYVPAGIDINNDTYWAQTGNYNAQIEQYRQEVLNIDADIEGLENVIPKSSFDNTNTVKKYIDDSVGAVEDVIPKSSFSSTNTVKKYIDSKNTMYRNKNVACIGDSWLAGYVSEGVYYPWSTVIRESGLFANVYDYAHGGGGFITPAANPAFDAQADTLIAQHGTAQDIDIIIVCGGLNDAQDTGRETIIKTAVQALVTKLNTAFPNATIYVGCNTTTNPTAWQIAYYDAIPIWASQCGAIGMNHLHLQMFGLFDYYNADRSHPNQIGYRIYGTTILSLITGQEMPLVNVSKNLTSLVTVNPNINFTDVGVILKRCGMKIKLHMKAQKPNNAAITQSNTLILSFPEPYKRFIEVLNTAADTPLSISQWIVQNVFGSTSLGGAYTSRITTDVGWTFNPIGTTSATQIIANFEYDLLERDSSTIPFF